MRRHYLSLLCAAACMAGVVSAMSAQDFKVTKVTTTDMGGALGSLARTFGGMGKPSEEIFSISASGDAARWDRGDQSSIMWYDSLAMAQIHHKKKEWYTYKLGDLMAMAHANMAAMGQTPPKAEQPDTAPDIQYKVTASVQHTGEKKVIAGVPATRSLLTVTAAPDKAKNGIRVEDLDTFVLLMEIWGSNDFAGNEAIQRVAEHAAEGAKQAGLQSAGSGMMQAIFQSPELKAAFEGSQAELAKMGAYPLEQLTVFVDLPPGVKLDVDAALTGPLAPGINLGAIAADAAKGSLNNKLGGLLGRKPAPAPEPEPAAPRTAQSVILRSLQVVKAWGIEALGPGWFGPPVNYKLKPPPWQEH